MFFVNSGSEANDTIVRLLRHYWALKGQPDRTVFIGRHRAYHGSTMASASLGGMPTMHRQGGLPLPGFEHVLQPDVSLHLRGQSSRFRARATAGGIGDFGAGEYGLLGGAEWSLGAVALNAEASMGTVTRSSQLLDGRTHETSATKRGVRLGALRSFETWGTLDGHASIETTEAGVGIPGTVLAASVRWNGITLDVAGTL